MRRLLLSLGMATMAATVPMMSAGGQERADTSEQARQTRTAAIDTIRAAELTSTAPVSNVLELLSARVPGLSVNSLNGTVGGSALISIRGPALITQQNEPLVYVDGVRINSGDYAMRSSAISVLNSLDPDEIEKVEVIKGAAGATLYSADASNGVIWITTRRGHPGERFTQRVKLGVDQARPHFTPPANFARCDAASVASTSNSTLCRGQAVGTLISDNPAEREGAIGNGTGSSLAWQGSGGGRSYTYFLSYGFDQQDGVLPSNQAKRHAGRVNFAVLPTSGLTIDVSVGLSRDLIDQVAQGEGGGSSIILESTFGNPMSVGGAANGWAQPYLGSTAIAHISDEYVNRRVMPVLTATYQPWSWFTNRLTAGGDVSKINRELLYPTNDSSWYLVGNSGYLQRDRDRNHIYTLDYLANVRYDLDGASHWVADLSLGTQLTSGRDDFSTATAAGFGTGMPTPATQMTRQVKESAVGYLGQLQLSYRDRLFLQYGARLDRNTALGSASRSVFRPKYGVSYLISNERFWKEHIPFIATLRLRSAYGTTGSLVHAIAGGGVSGNPTSTVSVSKRGHEFESGFDAGLAGGRVGVEFTYYNKTTKDLLFTSVVPSIFFTPVPVGTVVNRGVELALNADIISTRNVGLTGRFTMSTLHNELTDVDGAYPGPTAGTGFTAIAKGYPVSSFFVQKVTGVDVANNHAVVTDFVTYDGSPIPTSEGTVSGDLLLFRRLRLSGLAEFRRGYRKLDVDSWARDVLFLNSERAQTQSEMSPEEHLRIYGPYLTTSGHPAGQIVDSYVEDASFVRLREVSATMELPSRISGSLRAHSASITAGVRNLAVWTNYGGADPEAISAIPTGGLLDGIEQTTLPQPQRFYLRLNLGF